MSPSEYRQESYRFLAELEQRLIKEGFGAECKPEIVQTRPNSLIIRISNSIFELFNDGNRANWQFLGYI